METLFEKKSAITRISELQKSSRVDILDVARGILIILVVLGHSGFEYSKFLYWFHMPAFFIISGMLHKQPGKIYIFLVKKCLNIVIPYVAYGILIILIGYFFYINNWNLKEFIYSFAASVYTLLFWGGQVLKGHMTVFWFMNCFLVTIICFTLLKYFFKNNYLLIVTIITCYVIGYFLNKFIYGPIPWNLNVVPFTLAYFTLGYFTKDFFSKPANSSFFIILLTFVLCLVIISFELKNGFHFKLDLKYGEISALMLGILIPPLYTLFIFMLSANLRISKLKYLLLLIGQHTLPIMYLHVIINFLLQQFSGVVPPKYFFVLTGVFIPLMLSFIFKKYKLTQMLFLGKQNINFFKHT